ncbi:DUF2268 domain-containing protein [Nocardia sp. XZ_19_231]|uniref:DUF2268 domain-containing protein n=1 Tax=Nocardia sp. XZ_19_231 TaxID=2769252 RepID=UPI00188F5481|nr:DUF2268 domain-containing putative Zn-dependent protease [Nocardia sp. XZ_19_231]
MTIAVIDTAKLMTGVLDAPESERADLVRAMWAPMDGMYGFVPGGVDMARIHSQGFGFSWDEPTEEVRQAVRRLVDADAWNRVKSALERGVEALRAADPGAAIPDLTVLLVVGDPANAHFMNEVRGLSAFGGISGYIAITVWPTPTVVDRLEAIGVHELHHNVRYTSGGIVWDPTTVTVGEQVVAEGLADVFAAELYGEVGHTHFVAEETRTDDRVLAKVATGLDVTGMENFTAWVHGDASARLFGAEPVGLPTGAGYAAGTRMVHAYLEATGSTAAQSVRTPALDIIGIARQRLALAGQQPTAGED